jgi:hypothetical protein
MQLIAHQELASAAASITFSSIPQTFTDLYLVFSLRGNQTVTRTAQLKFNTSTAGFSTRTLLGNGSSASSFTATNRFAQIAGTDSTASTFTNDALYIPNYASAANKSFSIDHVRENNATASSQEITAGLWSNTAALTSVEIFPDVGSFVTGSSATLYGILAGSSGGVVVS